MLGSAQMRSVPAWLAGLMPVALTLALAGCRGGGGGSMLGPPTPPPFTSVPQVKLSKPSTFAAGFLFVSATC
jgi:hypothetical protein